MKKTTLAFLLVFGLGTTFSHAGEINTDFDHLHGAGIDKAIKESSELTVARPSAPSVTKSTHSAADIFVYDLKSAYDYQNLAERDGRTAARKLNAAGYKVLKEGALQNSDGTWGYHIEYGTPADVSVEKVQIYCLNGLNNYRYTYRNLAETDGQAIAGNLQAAGYMILERRVQFENGYWSCYIEYLPPAGVSAEKVQTYFLNGMNNDRYTYQNLAEADGKAKAAALRKDGYIVLAQRTQLESGYWSCYIDYIRPAGASAD